VRYLLGMPVQNPSAEGEDAAPSRKNCLCTREEMMRLIWMKATDEDISAMMMVVSFIKLRELRAHTPPMLPRRKRKELVENFQYIDHHRKGQVRYHDMVEAGLVEHAIVVELQKQYDRGGDGMLDCEEFVEMLCPYGYRAHEGVRQAILLDGQCMSKVTCEVGRHRFSGWLMDKDATDFRDRTEMPLVMPSEYGGTCPV